MRQRARTRPLLSVALTISLIMMITAGLLWVVLGDKGLLHAYRLKKDLVRVNEDIERLRKENEALRLEIESLKSDTRYMEKIAREELGMARKGEIVFVFGKGGKSPTPAAVSPPRTIEQPDPPGRTPPTLPPP